MKKFVVAATAAALLLLGACSNSETDYRDAAKKALSGKDAETALGQKMTDIQCDTPASKDVGTTFTCTAVGANDGVKYEFTATIESKKLVNVSGGTPVG